MFNNNGQTSARNLLKAFAFFRMQPAGRIQTGLWPDPEWTRGQFLAWFQACLQQKINRGDTRHWRCLSPECQADMAHDARLINDAARRIFRRGHNLLRTPEMRRRYPQINNNLGDA